MTCEELLTLPLRQRVRWLRSAAGPFGEEVSLDTIAARLGTSRQTVIGWEKGVEPRRYAAALAKLSGCPRETWLRGEEEVVFEEQILVRLRTLEAAVDKQGKDVTRSLKALAAEVRALAPRQDPEAPPATGTAE